MREDYKGIYWIFKRVFDISISIFILFLLIPLWVFIMLAVKLEEPTASPIFKQTRVGKQGHTFKMFKFRTMVSDAEFLRVGLEEENEHSGPIFKIKKDPRVTRVGVFLRKTSLDEFPQLMNVIKGDMSLIGPRPALCEEVSRYSEEQKKRLAITPGCTGLWQVSGRSNLCFEEMVELDLKYIENYGLLMDIKIFFRTFKVIFTGEGAY